MDIKLMTDGIDDTVKKAKNAQQDAEAKAQTTKDHAEGKPSSETLNKAKEKIKDALD
jgi:SOS response regulatory protein OraA/RecX